MSPWRVTIRQHLNEGRIFSYIGKASLALLANVFNSICSNYFTTTFVDLHDLDAGHGGLLGGLRRFSLLKHSQRLPVPFKMIMVVMPGWPAQRELICGREHRELTRRLLLFHRFRNSIEVVIHMALSSWNSQVGQSQPVNVRL